MAQKNSDELIKEQIKTLPKAVQEAIGSFDWARIVFDIGRGHNLRVNEIGEIQKEVMLVVLGLTSPREFFDEMVQRIGVPEDKAFEVAGEVNEKVFMRIREYMKTYYAEEEKQLNERKILNKAGIRFDDGVDLPEEKIKEKNIPAPKESEEELVPPPVENNTNNLNQEELVEKKPSIQLKDLPQTPPDFFDPYREPIE